MDLKKQEKACRTVFHGRVYKYNPASHGARTIGVCQLLGGDVWGVCWISETGGRRRVKSPRLPVLTDPDKLQQYLDAWAVERDLQETW